MSNHYRDDADPSGQPLPGEMPSPPTPPVEGVPWPAPGDHAVAEESDDPPATESVLTHPFGELEPGPADPEATSIVDRQWLAGVAERGESRDGDSEATSIVDRQWLAGLADQIESRHGGSDPHRSALPGDDPRWHPPREQFAGPPPPFGGPPPPSLRPRPRPPERPGPGWSPAAPAWSEREDPSRYPARATPRQEPPEWSGAQGSSADWNYVDQIRSSELVPTRRIPPRRGWRKALYQSTFKLFNPGQSPDERYEDELVVKARSLLRGTYKIGVLGKGGVGKSTVAAGVGSIFAELRQDDRVVAIDADTAFGKLGARIDPKAAGSFWELAADRNLHSFADMRSRVGSNAAGLFVLAGPAETARRRILDPAVYRAAVDQLDRHFTLSIVDCGSTLDTAVTREVLDDVDALIVVSSPWFDGASAAGQTLEWLANGGYTALLHRTVVVVNDSDGHAAKDDLALLVERFGKHGQKVIQIPYDQHLRPGGVLNVDQVSPLTRRRLLELAAECAEHFTATSDRPAGPRHPGRSDRWGAQ